MPAAASDITIEPTIGFNGKFQINKWSPLTLVLENTGSPVHAVLEVIVSSGSEYRGDVYHTTYSMDIELPRESKKLCSFTIFIDSFSHPLIIRLTHEKQIIKSISLNLRPHYVTDDLVLVLGNKAAPDFFTTLPEYLHPTMTYARFLPETWYGYDGVNSLILYADIFRILRPRQFHALTEWLKRGGYLIISGSLNYGSMSEQRAYSILSARISGFKQLKKIDSLKTFCGIRLNPRDSFLVLNAEVEDAFILLSEDGNPIIFEKNINQGKVIFTCFDIHAPPFTDWNGASNFWVKMFALRPLTIKRGINLKNKDIGAALLAAIPAFFPDFLITFTMLAFYLLIIKLVTIRINKKYAAKWKELCWLIMAVIIFTILGVKYFIYSDTQNDLTYNAFLHLKKYGKNEFSVWNQTIGIYALKEKKIFFELDSNVYSAAFLPMSTSMVKNKKNAAIREVNSGQELSLHLTNWSHGFIKIKSLIDFPIRCRTKIETDGILLVIDNASIHTIRDCRLFIKDRLFRLGDIAPGKNQEKRILFSSIAQKEIFNNRSAEYEAEKIISNASRNFSKNIKTEMTKKLLNLIHSEYQSRYDIMHFSGWITSPLIPIDFDRLGVPGESITFLDWEIPVDKTF